MSELQVLSLGSATASPPFNTAWFRSYSKDTTLNANTNNNSVTWQQPKHFTAVFSYFNQSYSIEKTGDEVNVTFEWQSSGENKCPSSCYADNHWCYAETSCSDCRGGSVNCLSGTGDFRVTLLDTHDASGEVTGDDWCPGGRDYGTMTKCVEGEPFRNMRGVDFRIFPHLTTKAEHEAGQVPCSIYYKDAQNLFGKARLGEWGCFSLPLNQPTRFSMYLKRRASTRMEVGMTMNGVSYSTDWDLVSPTDFPTLKQVNAIAIGYPNERRYWYVNMANGRISGTTPL